MGPGLGTGRDFRGTVVHPEPPTYSSLVLGIRLHPPLATLTPWVPPPMAGEKVSVKVFHTQGEACPHSSLLTGQG